MCITFLFICSEGLGPLSHSILISYYNKFNITTHGNLIVYGHIFKDHKSGEDVAQDFASVIC